MGFVVGRERMMGYGRFEGVMNALEGAVSEGEQALRNHYFDTLDLPRLHVPDQV